MPDQSVVETRLVNLQNWIVAGLVFIIIFVVTMTAVMLWQSYLIGQNAEKQAETTKQTHTALCALKTDVQVRRKNTVTFLKENPNGISGISATQIRQSIDNYDATLTSLSGLRCP